MENYFHSVKLDKEKCVGCTNCLKRCPTEAIRIRGGRAFIIEERCIDCGECIRVCQHHAKVAVTNPLASINRYPYKIALPAPALYGQFKSLKSIGSVPHALMSMGFDEVYDVARGADLATCAVKERLNEPHCPRPLISSSCPAVVRLIQTRFPELLPNVVDVISPMELAAREARRGFCRRNNVSEEDVGCFFITPCAAKMTAIRAPLGHETSAVSGAISILEIYGLISGQLRKMEGSPQADFPATAYGMGWARSGGECGAMGLENEALAVDGIDNVIRVLEAIENNRLPDLTFFEGLACDGGCIGGPLVFENGYIARNRIRKLVAGLEKERPEDAVGDERLEAAREEMFFTKKLQPLSVMRLDEDFSQAIEKMDRIEAIRKKLPGLDCGSCGSPTCQALAEDVVEGNARELDCLFLLKEQVKLMAQRMVDISELTREK